MTQLDSDQEPGSCEAVKDVLQLLGNFKNDGILVEEDLQHIRNVLESGQIKSLLNIYDKLEHIHGQTGIRRKYVALCIEVMAALERYEDEHCRELFSIMSKPFFRGLIDAHDNIVYETYKMNPILPPVEDIREADKKGPPIRVIGLTKSINEPLGVNIGKHLDGCVYIKRILPGTMVERQGLLAVGDIIKEINGKLVTGEPLAIEAKLKGLEGGVTLKVIPSFKETHGNCHMFMRCHFDYNHEEDEHFPRPEPGLSFRKKDIIEITDQADPRWWQACHVNETAVCGLVPSLQYEQMRRPYSTTFKGEKVFKGKKKITYKASEHSTFDCLDIKSYEEVIKMPAMERKLIVLTGAEGVGRESLKASLIENDPGQYCAILPDTSRAPRHDEISGVGYHFVEREKMAEDIAAGIYFEWGEYNGHLYGTRLDAIRDVMNAGKICVIACNTSALKILKTAEFMPLIVFIEEPGIAQLMALNQEKHYEDQKTRQQLDAIVVLSNFIKEKFHHYFDLEIMNGDSEKTYNTLKESIQRFLQEPQWVPVSWVY